MQTLQDTTTRALRRTALGKQREGRVPGLFAGVCRGGELLWGEGIGAADVSDPDRAPGPDDQFLIASNTKTFTAVMVMMLRDEGRLTLDDLLGDHVPEVSHPVTIRQCLAHVSGMAREPLGDVWDTLEQPDAKTLRRDFDDVERILRPHERWHYSNVVYAMLGQLVEELDGRPWEESLRTRLLDPLEMRRTTVGFEGAHVTGYYVPPYDDVPRPEPVLDLKAMAPCGGLASTPADLARWSAFVADPSALFSADTLEEMCQPQILLNPEQWTAAMGLGFFLIRSATGRTWVGHTGGMPGHITGLFTHRESGTGGIALMNATMTPAPDAFAIELADHVLVNDPVEEEPWRPGSEVPDEFRPLLGRWFSEGAPFVFSVAQGRLEARIDVPQASKLPPSVFEKVSDDVYRTVSGRERGELLRVTRGADGSVAKLNWATYLFTREPIAFGEHLNG